MSKAIITLDDKDGLISMSLFLEGGYQADSNAHQHAGLILKYLDELAGMKTEQAVQWVDGAYVPNAEKAEGGYIGLIEQSEPKGLILPQDGKGHLHLAKG
jgi:hypothetical protein